MTNNSIDIFFKLLQAGLWEKKIGLSQYGKIDYNQVYKLAEEQSVVGLVTAGLEHVSDIKVPQEVALLFAASSLQIEQRNTQMNQYLSAIVENMRNNDIYALLVKGQGIAQCYERPLWRTCGDIDFLLSDNNYEKAKAYLCPHASTIHEDDKRRMHYAMTIGTWEVELHGTLRCGLLKRIDKVIDCVQYEVFCGGSVRSWTNNNTQVFLPRADEDVIFVFTHILQHFFIEGIGMRQICDWSRLIWKYRKQININLLESRLRDAGLMTEWKAFASLAEGWLGMPVETIPLYSSKKCWKRKAQRIIAFILKTGNLGHKRGTQNTYRYPKYVRKVISMFRHTSDSFCYIRLFPVDAVLIWLRMMTKGLCSLFL